MKLVRDFIPKIDTSGLFIYRQATPEEFVPLLHAKLLEEVNEFLARPCLDEYVDIAEILGALAHYYGFAGKDAIERVDAYASLKRTKNGSFYSMAVQERIETPIPGPQDGLGAPDMHCGDQDPRDRGSL